MSQLRLAFRQLWKSPGFSLTVLITLALSIGANTAIFSILNALLLQKLPYPHPERLGAIYLHDTGDNSDVRKRIDGQMWELLRDEVPALFSAVYLPGDFSSNLEAGNHAQYVHAARVSARYFEVLGIQPFVGRSFTEEEDRPQGPKAVVLSFDIWRTVFNSDASILGRTVLLKGEPHTVVGVLGKNTTTPLLADVYSVLQPSRDREGASTNYYVITRLRPGATWQEADAQLNHAWANTAWAQRFYRFNPGAHFTFHSVPLQKGQTDVLRPQVLGLMLAAGFILLIACANLAGLTLVRMLRRTRDIATRLALGASSWQILKQVWTENLLLALAGGAAGIAVGFASMRGMLLLLPERFLPVERVPLDARVLGFTISLSMLTSILFGMLPALTARKVDLRSAMASRSIIGGGSVFVRQGLIAGEVALTLVLLAGAGLLVRTLIHLETLPPGFNPNGVIAAKASLDDARYHEPAAFRRLLDDSTAAMRHIPGVEDAAYALSLPYERALLSSVTVSDGKEAGKQPTANVVFVTPGYFATLQIPVLAGRTFTDADGPNAQRVAIVNQTFARKVLGGTDAVGRHLDKDVLVIGVVADTVLSSASRLHSGSEPLTSEEALYYPAAQVTDPKSLALAHGFFQPSWIVRTAGPVEGLTAQMQRALASADPNLPFSGFYSLKDIMAKTLSMQRVEVALLVAMASLALLLSAVGIFALIANLVAQRTREIGIRMALGSTIQRAMVHVGSSGMVATCAGLLLGLALCSVSLRMMRSVVWGVGVYDMTTLVSVTATFLAVALAATLIPARRVARIDPLKTLREE